MTRINLSLLHLLLLQYYYYKTMLDLFSYSSFAQVPKNVVYHYKHGNLNYPMIIYISLVHLVALGGILALPKASRETLLWAFCLWPIR